MQEISSYNPEIQIPFHKDIRFHPGLGASEKIFITEISSMAMSREDKKLPFSSRDLCKIFGTSHQTILNWINTLVKLDLIELGVNYNDKRKFFVKVKFES